MMDFGSGSFPRGNTLASMEPFTTVDPAADASEAPAWVLFVQAADGGAETEDFDIAEACCRYDGLEIRTVAPGQEIASPAAPVAVVIGARALAAAGRLPPGVPLWIVGVDADTDPSALRQVTGDAVCGGVGVSPARPARVRLCADRAVAGPLEGQFIPATAGSFAGLSLAGPDVAVISSLVNTDGTPDAPCCVRLTPGRGETWVSAASAGSSDDWEFERPHFGRRPHTLAVALMFLRAAAGDRRWHAPAHFANLCIDDPRLTEPYGRMRYSALLAEAQRAGFHATIGFIPWNYDRNAAPVVEIIRRNPASLSIAVHGNNHDRFEFYGPQRWRPGDPWRVKALPEQETALRQAAARMDEFSRLTGLPHDRVMVFPHAIGSAGTLRLLKRLGFAGTANYNNYPLGSAPPTDLAACLSVVNTAADRIPALRRDYPKNRSEWTVALDLFLGNPVLFMAHEDLFEHRMTAFNETAALVNRLEPAVRWTGLGEIFRGLYRQRRLQGDLWEVEMLSDEIDLRNESAEPRRCHVRREDPHGPSIEALTVNGADAGVTQRGVSAFATVALAPGETRRIAVRRAAEPTAMPRVELRRRGLRNRALRGAAEFRDLWLSGTTAGRWLMRFYYQNKLHRRRWRQSRQLPAAFWDDGKSAVQPPVAAAKP